MIKYKSFPIIQALINNSCEFFNFRFKNSEDRIILRMIYTFKFVNF